uniref:Uncharacterized protein n=1 Tax=Paramoeba aestuarina TaxID=180227 RepID=A0A7S4KHF7_9EUKA
MGGGLVPTPVEQPSLDSLPLIDQLEIAEQRLVEEERFEEAEECKVELQILRELSKIETEIQRREERGQAGTEEVSELKQQAKRKRLNLAAQSVIDRWKTPSGEMKREEDGDVMSCEFATCWDMAMMKSALPPHLAPNFCYYSHEKLLEVAKSDLAAGVRLKRCAVNSARLLLFESSSLGATVELWYNCVSRCNEIFESAVSFVSSVCESRGNGSLPDNDLDRMVGHFKVQGFFSGLREVFSVFSRIQASVVVLHSFNKGVEIEGFAHLMEFITNTCARWNEVVRLVRSVEKLPQDLQHAFETDEFLWGTKDINFALNQRGPPCSICLLAVDGAVQEKHENCGNLVDRLHFPLK